MLTFWQDTVHPRGDIGSFYFYFVLTIKCPPWRLAPRCSRGRLAPRAPSLGARAQCTAHVANGAPGPASCGPTRAHYAIPAPHGPLAYCGRLARCPGYPLSDTHHSQPRSQPITGLLHPSKRVSSLHSHQQQNDLHFVNLTNPLTHKN